MADDTIDAQLAELASRRANCLDLLVRCLIDIAAMDTRADVLLDRRNLDAEANEPDRMA
jgi:hypothetical protein